MLNIPGLVGAGHTIPKGVLPHIVASVRREAIRFSDKIYMTDQHLARNCFSERKWLEAFSTAMDGSVNYILIIKIRILGLDII
jgi:hypothetical protein